MWGQAQSGTWTYEGRPGRVPNTHASHLFCEPVPKVLQLFLLHVPAKLALADPGPRVTKSSIFTAKAEIIYHTLEAPSSVLTGECSASFLTVPSFPSLSTTCSYGPI